MPPPDSPDEITGQTALPLSRIKKIIQLDDDIVQCSNNATFTISVATEMFIRYLAEQGHNVVKSERKPRKNIQYRDLATAVSRIDNLEFLADVIPKTTTYKQFKEKKTKEAPGKGAEMEKGQRTLNGNVDYGSASGVNGDIESARPGQTPGHPRPEEKPTISVMINPTQSQDANMVDRTVEGQSTRSGYDHDVEMAG